jgi:hypothetical protein
LPFLRIAPMMLFSLAARLPRERQTAFTPGRYRDDTATLPPQEARMGTVMIRCPETGREIATGYEADPERFSSMPVFFARSYCPICRSEHEWFAQQAWVCEHDANSGTQRSTVASYS